MLARLRLGFPDNLLANLVKVVELLAGNVQELAPLVDIRGNVGGLDLAVFAVRLWCRRTVDELKDLCSLLVSMRARSTD